MDHSHAHHAMAHADHAAHAPRSEHAAQEMREPHATAEMMALDRRTSPGEWTVIVALIAATLAGGVMLLRKAARLTADERGTVTDLRAVQ